MKVPVKFLLILSLLFPAGYGATQLPQKDISFRPGYHFAPRKNWMNDPNGLVYYGGMYHLFFQYNPYGSHWGHMSWGHAVSPDLFHWKQQPVALWEEKDSNDPDTTMIFSGSAVVDDNNSSHLFTDTHPEGLVAIYTSHVFHDQVTVAQTQSIAFSKDSGSTWTKYKNNPVLSIHSTEFRDPKVFWYAPRKKWIMLVSKPDQHEVRFYESGNLTDWNYLSRFGKRGDTSLVWECPDIYQLKGKDSSGSFTRWVLSVSSGHPEKGFRGMQYFVGNFNGTTFLADPVPYPLYVDYGKDFYAGVTYNDIPARDGRTLMIGWADNWNYAAAIPTHPYRGIFALPRSLSLRKCKDSYRLVQQPVKELNGLHGKGNQLADWILSDTTRVLGVAGNSLDISCTLTPEKGATGGLKLLQNGGYATLLSFDSKKEELRLDRSQSGYTSFNRDFPGTDVVSLPAGTDHVSLRILIDKSIVEVFVNEGAYTITDLVFPRGTENRISAFSLQGQTSFSAFRWYRVHPAMND